MSIPRDAAVDYADMIDKEAEPVGPIHPGVILEEEFLEPLGLSAYAPLVAPDEQDARRSP
jgi:hypothetical protein